MSYNFLQCKSLIPFPDTDRLCTQRPCPLFTDCSSTTFPCLNMDCTPRTDQFVGRSRGKFMVGTHLPRQDCFLRPWRTFPRTFLATHYSIDRRNLRTLRFALAYCLRASHVASTHNDRARNASTAYMARV